MAGEIDELGVVNRALPRIGAPPIEAFDEDSFLSGHVNAVWPGVLGLCLSLHAWTFATQTYALSQDPGTPANGWRYSYTLPGGILGGPERVLRSLDERDVLRHFAFEGGKIYAHERTLWAKFRVAAVPSVWPPDFLEAVTASAAAHLALPVKNDRNLRNDLMLVAHGDDREQMRGGLMGLAIANDRARQPLGSPLLAADPLTMARYE